MKKKPIGNVDRKNVNGLDWTSDRFKGITRRYTPEDVLRLSPSLRVASTFAEEGSNRLWKLMGKYPYVRALGTLTGQQAVNYLKGFGDREDIALYLSGWQVAADQNTYKGTYPDQSLYPVNSVPELVQRLNYAMQRADQIWPEDRHWYAPIVADAEAGFGGHLNAFELMIAMIRAGAAGVHYEDQYSPAKKCGHMGGKVLIPTAWAVNNLVAARLAADVMGVPTIIIGRTDANAANMLISDADPADRPFMTGERTPEGFFLLRNGLEAGVARACAYAPYADLLWLETSAPDLAEAKKFAEGVHAKFPMKWLAYNCSPSFNWKAKLSDGDIARFQRELASMGYKFQFITLAGFHAINMASFDLARGYAGENPMSAYAALQAREFEAREQGYTSVEHQAEAGTGYFDRVNAVITGGQASTLAMTGSTADQF